MLPSFTFYVTIHKSLGRTRDIHLQIILADRFFANLIGFFLYPRFVTYLFHFNPDCFTLSIGLSINTILLSKA